MPFGAPWQRHGLHAKHSGGSATKQHNKKYGVKAPGLRIQCGAGLNDATASQTAAEAESAAIAGEAMRMSANAVIAEHATAISSDDQPTTRL
ncbi:MAG: hypothetical protein KF688_07640 [Pirellulales bacterium]|nr:hypothetical protein [Pirellulales bacterium]